MAVHHKYTFRLQLDLASIGGEVWMHVDMGAGAGQCLLNNFNFAPAISAKTLNNATGDVVSGITLGVPDPTRPGQAIFHSFASGAKGGFFDLTVTPAGAGIVGIALVSSAFQADLPTNDGQRPTAFGWISWDSNGNFTNSGKISGSGAGIQDQGFNGTMTAGD